MPKLGEGYKSSSESSKASGTIESANNGEQANVKQEKKDQKAYREQTNVRGIDISIGWDRGYDDYTIYFPQIEIGIEGGVPDQVLRISRKPEIAKQVFDFAVKKAEEAKDVYGLYRTVEKFSRNLTYEDDEEIVR